MTVYSSGAKQVIPKPKGTVKKKGSVTTTDSYQTVAEITVTKGKTFHPAKITVSCKEDVWVKIRWDGSDVSIEYLVMGKLPFTDWFPWNWNPMVGDGSKKVDVQAKYDTAAATVFCELCGEEV
jgi:hypothetical protein